METVRQRALTRGVSLQFSDGLLHHLVQTGFDSKYGARPLKRAIQNIVEDRLAEEILSGRVREGDHLLCDFRDQIIFAKAPCEIAAK